MVYERELEGKLFALHEDLMTGTYRHGAYEPFTVYDPKQRRIHKANVRDRVVHQAVVNVLEPIVDPKFIHDSYSCRVGKGTHAAVRMLRTFLLEESQNRRRTTYALKCDVRKFFDSVDHATLFRLLCRHVSDPHMRDLLELVISSFSTASDKGLPLGNLTSQLFANVYLHELDRFVKHDLHEKRFLRYCDDFVIVSDSRERLYSLVPKLNAFLSEHLGLHLHPNKVTVRSWGQGIDFLGYVSLPHATIVRTKTARRMRLHITDSNATSYLGLCTHASAYSLAQELRNAVWFRRGSESGRVRSSYTVSSVPDRFAPPS